MGGPEKTRLGNARIFQHLKELLAKGSELRDLPTAKGTEPDGTGFSEH